MSIVQEIGPQAGPVPSHAQANPGQGRNSASFAEALRSATGEGAPEGELPVEAYALPKWYAPYIPDANMLEPGLNTAAFELAERLNADGEMSERDKAEVLQCIQSDPLRQRRMARQAFREQYADELSEYGGLLQDAFRTSLQENGVSNTREYYEKIHLNKAASEQIHADMESRLKDNPRFIELMETLGTSF